MKKFLSMILALIMVISMLPTSFAAVDGATGVITYDFTYESRNQTENAKIHNVDSILPKFATYPKDQTPADTDAKDQWIYLGVNSNYSGTGSSSPWARIDKGDPYILTNMGPNHWPVSDTDEGEGYMALQIYVPAAGTYDLSLGIGDKMSTASENVDIYLGKTTDTLNQEYFISEEVKGTVTTLTDGNNPYTGGAIGTNRNIIREGAKKFSELDIPQNYLKARDISLNYSGAKTIDLNNQLVVDEAGDYLLIMHNKDTNSDGSRLVISSLTLNPVVSVSAEKVKLELGESTTLSTKVYNADGTVDTSAVIGYTSSDTSKFIIDGNTATAVGVGKAMITATVSGDPSLFGQIELEACDVPRDTSQDITYDFTYVSRNQTGNEMIHYRESILSSFAKYPKDLATPDTDAKDQWIYLGVNSNYSGTSSSAPWARIDKDGPYILTNMGENHWPVSDTGEGEGYMALQIYVPAAGTYDLSLGIGAALSTASENVDIYLGKTTDTLNQEYFESKEVKGIVTNLQTGATNPYTGQEITSTLTNRNVIREGAKKFSELGIPPSYLKASGVNLKVVANTLLEEPLVVDKPGDYLLIMRNRDTGESGNRLVLSSLTLSPMVVVSTDAKAVVDENKPKLSAKVYGFDGKYLPTAEVKFTTKDTDIISIEGNVVTPLKRGTATITAKATVDGKDIFGEYKMTVTSPKVDKLSSVSVAVDGKYSVPAYATRRVSVVLLDKYGAELTELTETPTIRVWYEIEGSDTPVEGIEDNGQWYITAPAGVDKLKLCAEVTYKGDTETAGSDIEIINTDNDRHVIIDFMNQPITDVYDATLEEHGWKFVSWDRSSSGTITLDSDGFSVTPRKAGKGVIQVKIPRSGYYSIAVSGKAAGQRAAEDVDVYLDGVYAGDYSFYKKGTAQLILPENFRTFYIEAGTHTITLEAQPRKLQVLNPVSGELEYVNNTYYIQYYRSISFFAEDSMPKIVGFVPSEESYDVNKGASVKVSGSLLFENGISHELMPSIDGARQDYSIAFELLDGSEYIDLADDGTVTANEVGTAHIKMTVTDNTGESKGQSWSETVEVAVKDYSLFGGVEITADSFVMRPGEREKVTLDKKAVTIGGEDFSEEVNWDSVEWSYDAEQTNVSFTDNGDGTLSATIDGDAAEGVYTVTVIATLAGTTYDDSATLTVTRGKAGRTYYTDERVAVAQENIGKYTWAKKEKDAAVKAADKYVALGMEKMWEFLVGEGIPRAIRISRRGDKDTPYICRYCGKKVVDSGYPWVTSPLTREWKIQCPECKRLFPSNDFGSFYELGIGNDGVFDRFLALSRHHNMIYHKAEFAENHDFVCDCEKPEMMDPTGTTALFDQYGTELTNWYKYYGYGQGYLKNDMYTELYTEDKELCGIDPFRYNGDLDQNGTPDRVVYNLVGGYDNVASGMLWCVDDGWGYAPGNAWVINETTSDLWTFIPHYVHNGLWNAGSNEIMEAIDSLRLAYIYTGDEKYGKIGAVMIDRIADLYSEYSSTDWVDSTGTRRNWNELKYTFSDNSFHTGKISNAVWDTDFATKFALAYDAFWPMYDDTEVQSFLAEKEAQYPGINGHPVTGEERLPKNSNKNIRDNIERDLIYEIYVAALAHDVNGNFGKHQESVATAALVYDREPATREMIDWVFVESKFNNSTAGKTYNTGGEILYNIINEISRDGQGTECSSSYNYGWLNDTFGVATALGLYKGEITEKENLWRNPKYVAMLTCYNDMIDLHRGTQSIGDQGLMGSYRVMPTDTNIPAEAYKQMVIYTEELEENLKTVDEADRAELEEKIEGYRKVKTELAQLMYEIVVKGKNYAIEDLHYDIFTKDPESLYSDIEEEIETYGEYDYDRSSMMTGYGFASLRGGALYNNVSGTNTIKDTTRDFWMYFGGALSHLHNDMLNIGIDAYGMSISSDNGYPEATGHYPSRHQWTNITLSHNTVVIDETNSVKPEDPAKPLHFDNKDTRVRLMDVDGSATYLTADEYRRTVLMIDYDDEVSYGVDFFKVLGGKDHIYSFHASSNTVTETTGLDSIEHQTDNGKADGKYIGTYAGADVLFGNDPWTNSTSASALLKYPRGYTWLEKIRKDNDPDMNFSVDYKISDMQKISRNPRSAMDVHLKVTTANDWTADEVTLAQSVPSRREGWDKVINRIEYLLIRRKAEAGERLDTLYTTIFQPYNKTPYIKSIDRIEMVPANGEGLGTDKAAAVRVELVDGRVDYVMYATRNDILYTVTDTTSGTTTEGYSFAFKGFAGVWTVKSIDGKIENVYSYIHDGTVIGDDPVEHTDALTGKVTWHTKGLSVVNKAQVEFDEPIGEALLEMVNDEKTSLSGRIFVGETSAPGNAAYIIEDAEISEDGKTAMLSFGNVTLVDSYDSYEDDTYNYIINEGTRFAIPMSYEENNAPEFDELGNVTVSAGSSLKIAVRAESQLDDGRITYSPRTLPRGASFNADTATFIWKPDGSQVGENLVAIDAIDSLERTSTLYFTVTVYGSTTGGSSSNKTEESDDSGSNGTTDTPAGGGGGGGGGAAPTDKPETGEDDESLLPPEKVPSDNEADEVENGETGDIRFTDLGNHSWAEDAINALAEDGIIKGTTASTFSPANNITRADFAILLVRAFKLRSDNTENFADVMVDDYYASELAIARNTGIVNGIGDNKYAPRNTITRQDMMVIVYRAMQKLNVGFGDFDEPNYEDFNTVADYAKEAVSALISAGLVNGKSGRIAPTDYTTRAEVAVLIRRILDFISE